LVDGGCRDELGGQFGDQATVLGLGSASVRQPAHQLNVLGHVVDDAHETIWTSGHKTRSYMQGTLVTEVIEEPKTLFVVTSGEGTGHRIAHPCDVVGVDTLQDAFDGTLVSGQKGAQWGGTEQLPDVPSTQIQAPHDRIGIIGTQITDHT